MQHLFRLLCVAWLVCASRPARGSSTDQSPSTHSAPQAPVPSDGPEGRSSHSASQPPSLAPSPETGVNVPVQIEFSENLHFRDAFYAHAKKNGHYVENHPLRELACGCMFDVTGTSESSDANSRGGTLLQQTKFVGPKKEFYRQQHPASRLAAEFLNIKLSEKQPQVDGAAQASTQLYATYELAWFGLFQAAASIEDFWNAFKEPNAPPPMQTVFDVVNVTRWYTSGKDRWSRPEVLLMVAQVTFKGRAMGIWLDHPLEDIVENISSQANSLNLAVRQLSGLKMKEELYFYPLEERAAGIAELNQKPEGTLLCEKTVTGELLKEAGGRDVLSRVAVELLGDFYGDGHERVWSAGKEVVQKVGEEAGRSDAPAPYDWVWCALLRPGDPGTNISEQVWNALEGRLSKEENRTHCDQYQLAVVNVNQWFDILCIKKTMLVVFARLSSGSAGVTAGSTSRPSSAHFERRSQASLRSVAATEPDAAQNEISLEQLELEAQPYNRERRRHYRFLSKICGCFRRR